MKIGIGIDTGGTYTDAAVYDFKSREILGTAKALTTRHDLSVGIVEALDALPMDLVRLAEVVALSTTLATNACVEDKGGSAKLIFFGGDKGIIAKYGKEYGLPPVSEIYIQDSHTKFSGEIQREIDWDAFDAAIGEELCELDGVGIIEMNAVRNSAVVEKKAKEHVRRQHDIPVVCGHELFNELNSLQRASSTLLNARLFPVIRNFMSAIEDALRQRGISATVVMVRSDGSLMSEEFARMRPIETLLSGPAASVLGANILGANVTEATADDSEGKLRNSIVVDMGGTTTDISLIDGGVPRKAIGGIKIGKWKTFSDGIYIKTVGLGGDSAIHYNGKQLVLEEYRVVPLCVAAEKYPNITNNLKKLVNSAKKHTKYLHEHFILQKDISGSGRYTGEEKMFCDMLAGSALSLEEAVEAIPGKNIYNLNFSRLLKEGVIQICGLTPTDIMHITGEFNKYSAEAAHLGAQYVAHNMGISVSELCTDVYDEIKRKLYVNIVEALLENKHRHYMNAGVGRDVERVINESYEMAKNPEKKELISISLGTDYVLTGVGAPIHVFLGDVAELLGTRAVLPQHYQVANALGAVVGNVHATSVVEIKPNYDSEGITGYTVYGKTHTKNFDQLVQAEEFAMQQARSDAHAQAVMRGAKGEITTVCRVDRYNHGQNKTIELGSKAIAQTIASIGL